MTNLYTEPAFLPQWCHLRRPRRQPTTILPWRVWCQRRHHSPPGQPPSDPHASESSHRNLERLSRLPTQASPRLPRLRPLTIRGTRRQRLLSPRPPDQNSLPQTPRARPQLPMATLAVRPRVHHEKDTAPDCHRRLSHRHVVTQPALRRHGVDAKGLGECECE